MKSLTPLFRHQLHAIVAMLFLAACGGNHYKPADDNFSYLLKGDTATDTLFVAAMQAPTAEEFDAQANIFFEAYARDFDDPGLSEFSHNTTYTERQDSLLFLMQDYLLNTFRYEESIQLGRALDHRLEGALANSPLRSACLGDISVAYFYLGNLEEAIKYQRIGYEIDLALDDAPMISSDLNQLAAMCLRAGKYEMARDYITNAIKVEEPLARPATLAIRYGLASEIYLKLTDYPTAETYALKALELDRSEGREGKVGIRLSQLAAIQTAQNHNAAAEESLAAAIPLLKSANNINSLAIANCQLGELELRKGNDAKAQQCFREALQLCHAAGIKPIEKRALHGLWLAMKEENPAKGAEYLAHYSALSDSLSTADADSQLANLKAEFATRELRMENERLEAQNRNNRIIIVISAILFLLLCIVAWLIYRNRSSRQRLMSHMERVRINFFTHITHEFRTPLTVILGQSAELEKQPEARQKAMVISEEGRNLLSLVNQLLDIGKINSEAGHAEWRHGNVIGYLNMLVESLRPLAVSRNAGLVFSPAANDVEMDFVPDYLRKIVANILSNALKYTGKDGHVFISARTSGSDLVLRFADDGTGIDPEDLKHIFEPFYQGTNSKTSVGTGVGLSLVKLLVKAMNGEISVKSSNGIGTVFIVSLPLKHTGNGAIEPLGLGHLVTPATDKKTDAQPENQEEQPKADDQGKPSVLIVEDNENVANYIASQLSGNYRIYTAPNGEEGYSKALNIVPDLIITDIMMPVMDGIKLLKKIRKNDILSHLPVMMLTARASDSDRIEGISAGADAYLAKPFNADELRAIAARLIEQRRQLCEKYRSMADNIADTFADDVANSIADSIANSADMDANTLESHVFIGSLISVIYKFLNNNRRTDMAEIAASMKMTERALSARVQSLTGETTVGFVNRVKIDKAKRILDTDLTSSLSDIAMNCGFEDQSYFSRIFKQFEGVTPSVYRRKVK